MHRKFKRLDGGAGAASRTVVTHFDGTAGALDGPAFLTRTGVFLYRNADGTTSRELRHPEDVFAPESLATLRGAPVVEGHPATITTDNWSRYAKGHVGDDVRAVGIHVAAPIRIQDGATLARAQSKGVDRLVELSCGYECLVTDESGTYDGEPYDRRQREIRYNHVGLGPEGWGRAGATVRLYVDTNETESVQPTTIGCYGEDMFKKMLVRRADNGETPASGAPAPAAAATVTLTRAEFDALAGRMDAATAEIARLKTAATVPPPAPPATRTATPIAKADGEAVRVRMDLLRAAEDHGIVEPGKVDSLDDKSDHDIRVSILAKLSPDLKVDGKSPDFVRGAYDLAIASRADHSANVRRKMDGTTPPKGAPNNGVGGPIGSRVDAARAFMIERGRNAWRTPVTKDTPNASEAFNGGSK